MTARIQRPYTADARHWRQAPMFWERRDFDLEGQIIAERRRREDRERKSA